jgi:rod shape-determining protein MreC
VHDSRRNRLVLGVLLAVALALITLDARNSSAGPVRGLRDVGGVIFGSAENVASAVGRPVAGFFSSIGSASSSQAKIRALQRQVVQLRGELSQAQVSKADEAQLRPLLQLAGRGRYQIVAANVIAASPPYQDAVSIDAGSADGIRTGETVLNGTGFVGVVTSVSSHVSTVLLATDGASAVGVRVDSSGGAGSGEIGLVRGSAVSGPGPAVLKLQVFGANVILQPGEQVVTFGGWPFAPGVPVGVISKVVPGVGALTKIAYVRPYVDDSSLGVVGVVVTRPRHNPMFGLLPSRPHPTPSATPHKTTKARHHHHRSTTGTAGGGTGG